MDFLFGLIGSFLVAFPAYLKHKLTLSGLFGAILLGTGIWGFGTSLLWVIMIVFFLTSSFVTNPHKSSSPRHGRNIIQVFANGGSALLCAIAFTISMQPMWLLIAVMIFAGSNGDTWGSEIGTRIQGPTYDVLTFNKLTPGLSGGVSLVGTLASFAGSLWIAITTWIYSWLFPLHPLFANLTPWMILIVITIGGFFITLVDSILGSQWQAKYQHQKTWLITDQPSVSTTKLIRGYRWMTNDAVNFISTLFVAIIVSLLLI